VYKYKLSVCISVHNTEKYLPRCLDSVVNQTIRNIEIVLVDNGSSDSSLEIMKRYMGQYPERHIIIVEQEDRGLAQGRQAGIEHASGKYLAFLDADDYVMPEAYETLVSYAECHQVDIVEMETMRGNQLYSSPYNGIKDSHEILREYFLGKPGIYPMIWLRVYSRALFEKPVMPNTYVNNEDIFAFPCLMYAAKNIGYIKEKLHVYSVDNEEAEMSKLVKKEENAYAYFENRQRTLKCIHHVEDFIGIENIEQELMPEFGSFKEIIIVSFLFAQIKGISTARKMTYIREEFGFSSDADVGRFARKYALQDCWCSKMIKIFGLRKAHDFYNLYKWLRK